MQITASHITPARIASDARISNRQQNRATELYKEQATTAEVIEAEFVDIYKPDGTFSRQEQDNVYLTLDPNLETSAIPGNNKRLIGKFQETPVQTQPPGSYINIFA